MSSRKSHRRPDITRRDFLNGASLAISGSMLPASVLAQAEGLQNQPGYYPPARTGMRGSHVGSFEVAHALRDGYRYPPGTADEHFDLVVVGGGISGLASAFFHRQKNPTDRVLILENHDDFGGHAKRNEFQLGERTLIGFGGTIFIESPGGYPVVAKQLLRDLGIDTERFYEYYDRDLYASYGLSRGYYFDKETFGQNFSGPGSLADEEFVSKLPLAAETRAELHRLYANAHHYLGDMSREEMIDYLENHSYLEYLQDKAGMGKESLKVLHSLPRGVWAIDIDAFPAMSAWSNEYPGFGDLELGLYAYSEERVEPNIFHFPDGNASIARMLVKKLIPAVCAAESMEDVVSARFDYSRLDDADSPVRLRLNSTVVRARHQEDQLAGDVDITYVSEGETVTVSAGKVVMAAYNSMIPYICPEVPTAQREALGTSLRAPLVYTNVLLKNWKGFREAGLRRVNCPGSFYHNVMLDYPVSIGDYRFGASPDEPMVVHLSHIPLAPGLSAREQFLAGRRSLYTRGFDEFEHHIRHQLKGILEGTSYRDDDIVAITVNRWPHGYAYGYDPETDQVAFEPSRWGDRPKLWESGRQRFGNIAVASSDSASNAMSEAAIEEAWRAVSELND